MPIMALTKKVPESQLWTVEMYTWGYLYLRLLGAWV